MTTGDTKIHRSDSICSYRNAVLYRGEKNKCPRRTYHWPYERRLFGVVIFFIFILNLLLVIFRILSDRQIYASEIKKFDRLRREKNPFFTKESPYLRNINNSIAGAKLNEPSRIFFDNAKKKKL
jgi:hypothetical protein